MLNYIEHHGVECLVICYVFSLLMSTVPPIKSTNFWLVWMYNFAQVVGANAGNLVKHTSFGKKLETLVSDSKTVNDDGTTTVAHVEQLPAGADIKTTGTNVDGTFAVKPIEWSK